MRLLFLLLWSSAFLVGSAGVRAAPPLTLTSYRFALAAAVLVVLALAARARWPRNAKVWGHLIVGGLLLQAVQFSGTYVGLSLGVPAGLSALLLGCAPLLVAAAAGPVLGEWMRPVQWIGSALGIAGVVLACLDRLHGGLNLAGVAFTLLGAAGFAAGTVYQRKFTPDTDLRVTGAVQLGVSAIAMTAVTAIFGEPLLLPVNPTSIGAVLWLALVNSIGAITLLFVLMRRRGGAKATGVIYLAPPLTAVAAVPLLGQPLSIGAIAGLAVAAIGVLLVNRAQPAEPAAAASRSWPSRVTRASMTPSSSPSRTASRL
ncbi:DMT family transporter [Fodinicola acaciae]|uniref:DMT family transporter n=1 Tax=Fodinicola acaciae TaxID=2681555 RepID=UPI0013D06FDC|nr:EamA family transporter [Fodinicola acaciae]